VQFLEVFCSGLLFEKIPFPVILFFHLRLTRNLPLRVLARFSSARLLPCCLGLCSSGHDDAGCCSIERARPRDLVSIVASWYVGSRAVMYSPLCPAYDRKLAILMSAALKTMQCAGSSSSLVSESAPPSGPRRQRPFGELATFSWYLDILASCIR
jgi:hypothetical protein